MTQPHQCLRAKHGSFFAAVWRVEVCLITSSWWVRLRKRTLNNWCKTKCVEVQCPFTTQSWLTVRSRRVEVETRFFVVMIFQLLSQFAIPVTEHVIMEGGKSNTSILRRQTHVNGCCSTPPCLIQYKREPGFYLRVYCVSHNLQLN